MRSRRRIIPVAPAPTPEPAPAKAPPSSEQPAKPSPPTSAPPLVPTSKTSRRSEPEWRGEPSAKPTVELADEPNVRTSGKVDEAESDGDAAPEQSLGKRANTVELSRATYEEKLARARERIERDARRQVERQRRQLIAGFIEVLDDIDRAFDATTATSDEQMRAGVEMVRDRFLAKLAEHGVIRVKALGTPFDPALHEAVTVVAVDEASAIGTVVKVLRHGYTIDGEMLRAAMVAVGR